MNKKKGDIGKGVLTKGHPSGDFNSGGSHLEDCILEVEKRGSDSRVSNGNKDVFNELAQKEKDLILAAEVGKALLEKNNELTLANERITEEYSHNLELLEQEKHALRRRLDNMESDYESRLSELQNDLAIASRKLEEQQASLRGAEKEKSRMLQELSEQNYRLTHQLKEASHSEDTVSTQLQSLREQFNARRSNLHDHVIQMDSLREEMELTRKQKENLEKRITILTEERDQLSLCLDEAQERILMLDRRNKELEEANKYKDKEMDELRHVNSHLNTKVDTLRRISPLNSSSPVHPQQPTSLYNEIEMSSSSSIEDELAKPFANDSDEDIDVDNNGPFPPLHGSWKNRRELLELYHNLRQILRDLHRRREASSSFNSTPDSGIPDTPEEIPSEHVGVGLLTSVIREVQSTLKEIFPEEDGPCAGCRMVAVDRNELARMKKEVAEKVDINRRMTEEINELTKRVTIQEVELNTAREERDNAKHLIESQHLPKDQMVNQLIQMKESAVARKNQVEVQLAHARIEVMHINGQLMESVQQKVELSQQLEQWQVDMQALIDDQLRRKLTEHEEKRKLSQQTNGGNDSKSPGITTGFMNKSKLLKLWR